MNFEKIKEVLTRDMGKGSNKGVSAGGGEGLPSRQVYKKEKDKKLLTSVKRRLFVSVEEGSVRGVVMMYKDGQMNVESLLTFSEGEIRSIDEKLSIKDIREVKGAIKTSKSSKKTVDIVFGNIQEETKVVKYPPLDKKMLQDMIDDSFVKFFPGSIEELKIRGVESLGDMSGDKYIFLSTVLRKDMVETLLKMEKNGVQVGVVYNQTLALKNVLNSVDVGTLSKCMVYMKRNKVEVLIVKGGTLIFHKVINLESENKEDFYRIGAELYDDNQKRVVKILPDLNSTIDYVHQKEGLSFNYILLAGDLVNIEGAVPIINEGTGIQTKRLDVSEQTDAFELLNWSGEEIGLLNTDYIIPYGLSLRGVVV